VARIVGPASLGDVQALARNHRFVCDLRHITAKTTLICDLPSSRALKASSIAARLAWVVSGAGTMPATLYSTAAF